MKKKLKPKTISLCLTHQECRSLDLLAARYGVTRSHILRWAAGVYAESVQDEGLRHPDPDWAESLERWLSGDREVVQ